MRRGSWVLIAGLLLTASSCAQRRGSAADAGATQPTEGSVRVHVTNHYKLSMEVYALGSGITQRLGLVSPGIDRDFMLPEPLVNSRSVEFLAQPSGTGPTVRTGEIRFEPGDVVDFEIATNLLLSRATVRL